MWDAPEDDDLRIRDALMAGRESALAEAYDTHAGAVYGLALHITRDTGVAEDIVQEVFADLWQRPERFDASRSRLRGWLCMISRRRAIASYSARLAARRDCHARSAASAAALNSDSSTEAATEHRAVAWRRRRPERPGGSTPTSLDG